jgi:protein-disulfide isomerase
MNRRTLILAIGGVAVLAFGLSTLLVKPKAPPPPAPAKGAQFDALVRPHSPVLGRADAPVTVVEFFDPSCETCRAMEPHVKKLLADYPDDVRVVIRYAAFHEGSDEAVRILEAARKMSLFGPVKEALLAAQPQWAVHSQPNLALAWDVAKSAGIDLDAARKIAVGADIADILKQDTADAATAGVRQTPTFFVNGKPLPSFGIAQLNELVRSEVAAAKAQAPK